MRFAAGLTTATAFICAILFAVPTLVSSSSFSFGRSVNAWQSRVRTLPLVGPFLARLAPQQEVMGGLVMEPADLARERSSRLQRKSSRTGDSVPTDAVPSISTAGSPRP